VSTLITDTSIYTTGGTVQAGKGVYIPRQADDELLDLCRAGKFTYILTARQMGKSSVMVRTSERLMREGIKSVAIDLTKIGAAKTDVTAEKWYFGLLLVIKTRLGLKVDLLKWWDQNKRLTMAQRMTDFFEQVLLVEVKEPVVIFIDEIDTTLRLSFTDDFYAAVRYVHNDRALVPVFNRLSFVLIGVAKPGDLIQNPDQTPFNIGQGVELTDFNFDEALPLADGLGLPPAEARETLRWVLEWTSGHPYLTQRLCLAIAEQQLDHWTKEDVERVVASTFFGEKSEQDNNLQFVRDMLIKRTPEEYEPEDVLLMYRDVYRERPPVVDEEQSVIKTHLKLSGVVCRKGGILCARNEIYRRVFNDQWIEDHLPPTWTKRQLAQARRIQYSLAGLLLLVLILTAVASTFAYQATRQKRFAVAQATVAQNQRQEADKQRAIAENAVTGLQAANQLAEQRRQEAEAQTARANETAQRLQVVVKELEKANAEASARRQEAEHQRNLAQIAVKQLKTANDEAQHQRQLAVDLGSADRSYREGTESFQNNKFREALAKYQSALPLYKEDSAKLSTLILMAKAQESLEEWEGAIKSYYDMIDLYQKSNADSKVAGTFTAVADIYSKKMEEDHDASAVTHYERARKIYQRLGDSQNELAAVRAIGLIYIKGMRDEEKAAQYLNEIRQEFIKSGDSKKEIYLLLFAGTAYARLHNDEKAVQYFKEVLQLYKNSHDLNGEGDMLERIAQLHEGNYDSRGAVRFPVTKASPDGKEPVGSQQPAIYIDKPDESKPEVTVEVVKPTDKETSGVQKPAAFVERDVKDLQLAIKYYTEAAEVARQLPVRNYLHEAFLFRKIGQLNYAQGHKQESLNYYQKARSVYQNLNYLNGETRVILDTVALLNKLGDKGELEPYVRETDDYLKQTLQKLHQTGGSFKEVDTLNYIAEFKEATKDEVEAVDYYTQAFQAQLLQRACECTRPSEVQDTVVAIYEDAATKQKMDDYYDRMLTSYRNAGDHSGEARTLESIGTLHWMTGNPDGFDYFNRALSVYRQNGDKSGEARALLTITAFYSGDADKDFDKLGSVKLKNLAQEKIYYEQAERLYEQINDPSGEVLLNLRRVATYSRDAALQQKRLDYALQVVKLYQLAKDPSGEAYANTVAASTYTCSRQADDNRNAALYFERAVKLFKEQGDYDLYARTIKNMSRSYETLKNEQKVRELKAEYDALEHDLYGFQ
jgi:tetratricopeptide (TPR) repeat protein